MHLTITPGRRISEVQHDFNTVFPFLKLEFFHSRSFSPTAFTAANRVSLDRKLGELQQPVPENEIEIGEDMIVKDLEKMFRDRFNLAVQVFRKSGNLWLETTMTDNWTLRQQNNHGEELSTIRVKRLKPGNDEPGREADL